MGNGYESDSFSNPAPGPTLDALPAVNASRRRVLKAGLAGVIAALPVAGCGTRGAGQEPLIGFQAVPASTADRLTVLPGYRARVLYRTTRATLLVLGPRAASRFSLDPAEFAGKSVGV